MLKLAETSDITTAARMKRLISRYRHQQLLNLYKRGAVEQLIIQSCLSPHFGVIGEGIIAGNLALLFNQGHL